MGLIEQAQKDTQSILSDLNEFGVVVKLTAPDNTILTIGGYHTKHNTGFDLDGAQVQAKTAYIAVSVLSLAEAGYPFRDGENEIVLLGHRAEAKDVSGVECKYVVRENYPDETAGIVVLILSDSNY